MKTNYYTVADIMAMFEIGKSKAYQIIKELNAELEAKGYITIAGKVPKKYVEERFYEV